MDHLWAELVGQLVRHGEPTGPVVLLADDTRFLNLDLSSARGVRSG